MAISRVAISLLSAICKAGSTTTLTELPDAMFTEDELPTFRWLKDYVRRYRKIPNAFTFKHHTGEAMVRTFEPLPYYLEEAKQRALYYAYREQYGKFRDAMNNQKPYDALEIAKQMVATSQQVGLLRQERYSELGAVLDDVVRDYEEANAHPGLRGITTGWPYVDAITGGHQNGDCNAIVGRPEDGKSQVLLRNLWAAWKSGKTVLGVSMEMPNRSLGRRLIGLELGLNPRLIRDGLLSTAVSRRMAEGVELMKDGIPFYLVAGGLRKSVPLIRALSEELQPDIIGVDASYLMQPEKRSGTSQRREVVSDVMAQLKEITVDLNRPLLHTVQLNRQAARPTVRPQQPGEQPDPLAHIGIDRIYDTDVVGQLSSVVYGLARCPAPHQRDRRWMGTLKGREGEYARWMIHYSFSPMNFDVIPPSEYGNVRGVGTRGRTNLDWMGEDDAET